MRKQQFLLILFLVFLTCGCSKTTLTCHKETPKEENNITITFKDELPNEINYKRKLIYDKFDALIELDYYDELHLLEILESDYFTYDIKLNDRKNYIEITEKINYEKLDKSLNYNLPIINKDYDNNKYYLETNGYICK